jgi:pimeloyl-ACP methyl ester carboxylesterase
VTRLASQAVPAQTVLLLHAFPLDARMWEPHQAALESAGNVVEAPNLPGEPAEVGFEAWARRILAEIVGDLVPVGCSMGGYLTFELWRQAPERIRALALLDTRATPDSPEQRQARDDSIRLLGEAGFEPFWEGLAPRLFAPNADAEVVARARAIAAEQPSDRLVAALETLRDRPDSRETLATIDVPVLVAVGEEDVLTPPADAEELAARIPAARLLRVAGAGHLAPLERPNEVTQALLELL